MNSLVDTASQKARKLKVKLDVNLNRGKALWASTSGDVPLEIRKPEPSRSTKRPPRKTRQHEIHRADEIAKEMEKQGWSAAEYARQNTKSRVAVSLVLKWHKLSPEAKDLLRKLSDAKEVKTCGRHIREGLLKLPPKQQLSTLRNYIKKAGKKQ
jgi:hypothetical protein